MDAISALVAGLFGLKAVPGISLNKPFRNGLDKDDGRDPDRVAEFEVKYDEILAIAQKEYEYEPPSKYYVDGFNLYKKLRNYKEGHLEL
jgi:hypothetical protein